MIIKKNPLFFAFLFPAIFDGVITLLGQSPEYWSGLGKVNEASPAYYFLLASPWVFIFGSIVWLSFWYWVVKHIKEPLNFLVMFIFLIGHSWGGSTWVTKMLRETNLYILDNQVSKMLIWGVLIAYFILTAILATYCLHLYIKLRR